MPITVGGDSLDSFTRSPGRRLDALPSMHPPSEHSRRLEADQASTSPGPNGDENTVNELNCYTFSTLIKKKPDTFSTSFSTFEVFTMLSSIDADGDTIASPL